MSARAPTRPRRQGSTRESSFPGFLQKLFLGETGTTLFNMFDRLFETEVTAPVEVGHGDERGAAEPGIAVKINGMSGYEQRRKGLHRFGQLFFLVIVVKISHGNPVYRNACHLVKSLHSRPIKTPLKKVPVCLKVKHRRHSAAVLQFLNVFRALRVCAYIKMIEDPGVINHDNTASASLLCSLLRGLPF